MTGDDSVQSRMGLPRNLTIALDGNEIFGKLKRAWPSTWNGCFTTPINPGRGKHPSGEAIIKASPGGNVQQLGSITVSLCLIPKRQFFYSIKKLSFQVSDLFMATRPDDKNVVMDEAHAAPLCSEAIMRFPPKQAVLILDNSIFI